MGFDLPSSGKVRVKHYFTAKALQSLRPLPVFPLRYPRELQGVRRCAAAGRAGGWQLRAEGWLNLEGTPDSGRHFKMSVSSSSTAPPASRAFCSCSSPAVASHAPSSKAPESADSPVGRSLDDGFRSPTDGSASSPRLLSSPARPQCESVSLFAAVRRQEHKAMRSRHMAVIIGRQHPVLRRQPALEQSVLASPLSCRDGSGEIKQDFKELVHDDRSTLWVSRAVGVPAEALDASRGHQF